MLINIFVRSQDPNQHNIHNILTTHIIKHIFQECGSNSRMSRGSSCQENLITMSRKATACHSSTYGHAKETFYILFMTKECLYWAARNKMMNLYVFWGVHRPQNKAWWRLQTMNLKGQARILKRGCRIWRSSQWKNQKYSISSHWAIWKATKWHTQNSLRVSLMTSLYAFNQNFMSFQCNQTYQYQSCSANSRNYSFSTWILRGHSTLDLSSSYAYSTKRWAS